MLKVTIGTQPKTSQVDIAGDDCTSFQGDTYINAPKAMCNVTVQGEFFFSNLIAFRKANLEAFQKKHGVKLGFMSAFLKAAAHALQEQPVVNAVIDGNEIIYRDYIDISVAVATPKVLKLADH